MHKGRGCDHALLVVATLAGICGVFAFIGAWIAAFQGELLGFDATLWYDDAQAAFLLGLFLLMFVKVRAMHGAMCEPCGGASSGSCCKDEK